MKKLLLEPILVTGGTGFIGANLVRNLTLQYSDINLIIKSNSNTWRIDDISDSIRIYHSNLNDFKNVEKIINDIKPKTIFHLAAYGAYHYQKDMNLIKMINLDCTINLLKACEKYGFNIFVNTGSNSEYGFSDNAMKETDVLIPNSYYSVFKSATTLFCQYESVSKALPIVTLRPFHVYGPFEEKTRFIPVLIKNLLKGECPPLVSQDIKRDMIFIDDVIDFYQILACSLNGYGEIYNLGSGDEYTIKDIVNTAIDIINVDIKPKWNTMKRRSWDSKKWKADMNLVNETFNWKPQVSLFEGMKKTINWHKIHS